MNKIDKIKSYIAIGLLALVVIPFVALGKDHDFTRTAAAFAIIAWLGVVFYTNRLKKKDQ